LRCKALGTARVTEALTCQSLPGNNKKAQLTQREARDSLGI